MTQSKRPFRSREGSKAFIDIGKKVKATTFRQNCIAKKAREIPMLLEKGWRFDGLWYHSPHTGIRYHKTEALYIEEIRAWAKKSNCFLGDKDHSTWAMQREKDYSIEEETDKRQESLDLLRLLTGNPHISLPPES